MFAKNSARVLFMLAIVIGFGLSEAALAQEKSKQKEIIPAGTPVLWRESGDIASRDLLLGAGGAGMKPDLSSITFIKEETGGYSPKFRVRDGGGKVWVAKLGKESQPETASARLIWAVGYVSEIHYLIPCIQIKNAPEPKKKVDRCEGNGFANVRFEARPEELKRLTEWSWQDNPFKDSREFKGLIVLMALINNWDLKDANNKILLVPGGEGGGGDELHYIISDLGATFGKTGNFITHNRNSPKDFVKSKFIKRVEGGQVVFAYDGKNKELMRGITVEDAKWIGSLLAQLTDKQIEDAFRAANFAPEEIQTLTEGVRERINQLAQLTGATANNP